MKFGEYLRQLRDKHQWTQPIAAEKIGIEQSYLSKLESSKSVPSDEVFNKLVDAYEIDLDDMTESVSAAELACLKDVKSVATRVQVNEHKKAKSIRSWLIAAVLFVAAGGACLGVAMIPDASEKEYHYRSQGILKPGEDLTAFNLVDDIATPLTTERQGLIDRIDQQDRFFDSQRGHSYVESVPGGKRYYQLIAGRQVETAKRRKWFIAPALALLFGGVGCFLISRT